MRVKLLIESTKLSFWFNARDKDTIQQLQQKVIQDLKLSFDVNKVELFLDGCTLLKHHTVNDILRENDEICLKKIESKKRKQEKVEEEMVFTKREKKETEKIQRKYEKLRRNLEKLKLEKNKEAENQKKLSKEQQMEKKKLAEERRKHLEETEKKESKLKEEKKMLKEEQKQLKKLKKEMEQMKKDMEKKQEKEKELMKKQQKEKELKKKLEEEKELEKKQKKKMDKKRVIQNEAAPSKEFTVVPVVNNGPIELLGQERHTVFDLDDEENATHEHREDPKNLYGRAMVTYSEAAPNNKRTQKANNYRKSKEYPIDKVPTFFYATKPSEIVTEESSGVKEVEKGTSLEKDLSIGKASFVEQPVDEAGKDVNYEECQKIDLEKSPPSVGDRLAIKTLELTASYTPEVSDWKEVSLVELNSQEKHIVIEFLKGFSKASTKGGKFDLRKKRNHYYETEEYVEEEEEDEEPEDNTAIFMYTDIFDIRKL